MSDIKFPTHCAMVSVNDLTPYEKNPKNHNDKDIGLIIKSIRRNGWGDALLVCPETKEVLSGNGRLMAAIHMGLSEVPVVYAPDGLSEKQKADLVIASNKLVEVSDYNGNLELLMDEFGLNADDFGIEVPEFDMNQVGEKTDFDDIAERSKKEKVCPNCGYKLK